MDTVFKGKYDHLRPYLIAVLDKFNFFKLILSLSEESSFVMGHSESDNVCKLQQDKLILTYNLLNQMYCISYFLQWTTTCLITEVKLLIGLQERNSSDKLLWNMMTSGLFRLLLLSLSSVSEEHLSRMLEIVCQSRLFPFSIN